jgi:hypothetical protein
MAMERKSLDHPDGTREYPNRTDCLVTVGATTVARADMRPGWRWTNDVRPIAGTTSCQTAHTGYIVSGQLHVESDDGTTIDLAAGDVFDIPPGHDAWVVGDEPCRMLDWAVRIA